MAGDRNPGPLHLYVSPGLARWLERNRQAIRSWLDVGREEAAAQEAEYPLNVVSPFAAHEVGDLLAEPVEAAHRTLRGGETVQSCIIRLPGGRRLLYACDTGWYPEPTWEYLRGRHVELLALECTLGGRLDHEGLQAWFDGRGLPVRVAYDGLEIEV